MVFPWANSSFFAVWVPLGALFVCYVLVLKLIWVLAAAGKTSLANFTNAAAMVFLNFFLRIVFTLW